MAAAAAHFRCSPAHATPLRLYDFPVSVARPDPDSKCQGLPALGLPCLMLGPLGVAALEPRRCAAAAQQAVARACDALYADRRRSPLLKYAPFGGRRAPSNRTAVASGGGDGDGHGGGDDGDGSNDGDDGDGSDDGPARALLHGDGWPSGLWEALASGANAEAEWAEATGLPAVHTITLGADEAVAAENEALGLRAPRALTLGFLQRPSDAARAAAALRCVLAWRPAKTPALDEAVSVSRGPSGKSALEGPEGTRGGEPTCEPAWELHVWHEEAWANLVRFELG